MIHAYIGDGKGKTTAACGLAVRYAGSGKKVEMLQFLKDGSSCENKCFETLNIRVTPCQKTKGFFWTMTDDEKKSLEKESCCGLEYAKTLLEGDCDMVVLDEILGTVENGLIDIGTLRAILQKYGKGKEIVLTGRKLPEELTEMCDYISEIKKIKHPFDKGMGATKGIEF